MAEFTLHCFAESGNAYKVALMLQLCGADWEPTRVGFFDGETRSEGFRAINAMGEVPVLIHHRLGGDFQLTQSGSILIYLARHFGRFGHSNEPEEFEILRWILFDNHKLTSYTATARFMRHFRKKTGDPAAEFIYTRAKDAWKVLDGRLQGREWVVGDRPTIADFSLCGYLFWPEQIDADWNGYPSIKDWLTRLSALDGFALPEALMPSGQ
jgi:glutathione S-transferase